MYLIYLKCKLYPDTSQFQKGPQSHCCWNLTEVQKPNQSRPSSAPGDFGFSHNDNHSKAWLLLIWSGVGYEVSKRWRRKKRQVHSQRVAGSVTASNPAMGEGKAE